LLQRIMTLRNRLLPFVLYADVIHSKTDYQLDVETGKLSD